MRPDEFGTLASIDRIWRDDERLHRRLYDAALALARDTPELAAHRDYTARNMLGFGDPAFHGVWSLLVDAMPESFRFLEAGVYKGSVLSLVGMLACRRGKSAIVTGVGPLNGEGDRYGDPPGEDYAAAVHALETWCGIPAARHAMLIAGQTGEARVRETCLSNGPYDIVFLDGGRTAAGFEADLAACADLVATGGYLVVYRASAGLKLPPNLWPGSPEVARAIAAVLDPDPRFRHVAAFGHMRVWTKRADDPAIAAVLAAQEIPVTLRFSPGETRRFGGTPGQQPDLAMTFAMNYSFAEIESFVASLLNHGENIHLTVFATNMDESFHILAERLNIEVIDAQPYLPGWHINNVRFKAYQDYLRDTRGKWRNALLSDVRDVLFQADPFGMPLPAPVVFAAEDALIGTTGVNHAWLTERYGRELADSLAAKPIVCAGTTIGTASGIANYVDAIWNEIGSDSYDHSHPLDQGSHNYIAWHLSPEWGLVDLNDRIMATIGLTSADRVSIVNERIMVDGAVPPILHQWDRKPGLAAFVGQSPRMRLKS